MPARLMVLACSATKRRVAAPVPAIDLYAGPIWQSLRTRLAELPLAAAAVAAGDLVILVLSAEHGFISADKPISFYDRRLDRDRAKFLSSDAPDRFAGRRGRLRREVHEASEILVVGGELYRDCVARTVATGLATRAELHLYADKTTWTKGRIGQHRHQLNEWLRSRYRAEAA